MKKILFILFFPIVAFAAPPTPDCSDVSNVRVGDVKGNLHYAGDIRDVVKNYPAQASSIRSEAKTAIEAKITAAGSDTYKLSVIKDSIDKLEAAGGSVDSTKKSLVTNSVTIEAQKDTDRDAAKPK